MSEMEFNVPFQHKHSYIRDERPGMENYPYPNTVNINTKQAKPRFGRLLRPPAWKRRGSIFWKVRDRRRDRRKGKMHKKGRKKNTNRKGKQNQTI